VSEKQVPVSLPPPEDFAAVRRRQLTAGMEVPPYRRLEWLEEAITFAFEAGALPKKLTDDLVRRTIEETRR
jgi:hypothetical protein